MRVGEGRSVGEVLWWEKGGKDGAGRRWWGFGGIDGMDLMIEGAGEL